MSHRIWTMREESVLELQLITWEIIQVCFPTSSSYHLNYLAVYQTAHLSLYIFGCIFAACLHFACGISCTTTAQVLICKKPINIHSCVASVKVWGFHNRGNQEGNFLDDAWKSDSFGTLSCCNVLLWKPRNALVGLLLSSDFLRIDA